MIVSVDSMLVGKNGTDYCPYNNYILSMFVDISGIILEGDVGEVVSQKCPTSLFFKLTEKLFYIGYRESTVYS